MKIWPDNNQRSKNPKRGDFLAVLPWVALPYDSVAHLLGNDISAITQTLPLTALIAIPYLVLRGRSLRSNYVSLSVFNLLLLVFIYMLLVTVVNVLVENIINLNVDHSIRPLVAGRQAVSMMLGLCSFLMFQDAILRINSSNMARYILWGFIPTLMISLAQFIFGADRIQGFSSEPSHLADILVFVFFPACALFEGSLVRKNILFAIGLGLLLVTFSTTGYVKAALAVLTYYVLRGEMAKGILQLLILFGIALGILNFSPDNYVFNIFRFIVDAYEQTGQIETASFIDRFFGFAAPFSKLGDIHGWVGYGFGGDSVYFDKLFSESTASVIRDVKGDIASISSLQGKMLMYGGVLGYVFYLLAWRYSIKCAPHQHISRIMIPVVFASSVFSLGPIFLPYIWLWFAIGACSSEDDGASHSIPKIKLGA